MSAGATGSIDNEEGDKFFTTSFSCFHAQSHFIIIQNHQYFYYLPNVYQSKKLTISLMSP